MPDEARDWEQLRSDAIRAAREVTGDDGLAEQAADAVLEVIDDETVRRLSDKLISETYLRSMDFRNGATMEIKPARALVAQWVGAARALLDGAENYSETLVDFGIPEDPQRYSFVVQKAGKVTPHEARRKAEAALGEALAEVERLRSAEVIEWGVRFTIGSRIEQACPDKADARAVVAHMQEDRPDWDAAVLWRTAARPAGPWNEEATDADSP